MRRHLKLGKMGGVVFLTVLIWVWADLALERSEDLPGIPMRISITPPSDPALAISFENEGVFSTSIPLTKLRVVGPDVAIQRVTRNNRDKLLEFVMIPSLNQPGTHTVQVLDFLRQEIMAGRTELTGLGVEACEPENLTLHVEALKQKSLRVQCVDQDQRPIEGAVIEPLEVDMYVPADQTTATVALTEDEVSRARISPIEKKPFVQFLGRRHIATEAVRISTPDIEVQFTNWIMEGPVLGFVMSPTVQEKYRVELLENSEIRAYQPFRVSSTPEAQQAYQSTLFHTLLEVLDSDERQRDPIGPRRLKYNFPQEFADQIRLAPDQSPVSVTFRLVPINGTSANETTTSP